MSAPRTHEAQLLARADRHLTLVESKFGQGPTTARIEVLEAFAAHLGGWDLNDFRAKFPAKYALPATAAAASAVDLAKQVKSSGIEPALAIASLARPALTAAERRSSGAFYTDFRLARSLASMLAEQTADDPLVLDPASGTGILLVAFVLEMCGGARTAQTELIRSGVCAADMSRDALRGARAALASLTDDLGAVGEMNERIRQHDSLLGGRGVWADVAPMGFSAVIGNPPWEKLKVSRHEHLRSEGDTRHYGDDYRQDIDNSALHAAREDIADYVRTLESRYPHAASGEPDLYKLFIELSLLLSASNGSIGLLVPAGLIRSQSTFALRERLFESCETTKLALTDNRSRFFEIDTRFKFVAVVGKLGHSEHAAEHRVMLTHHDGKEDRIVETGSAHITLHQLRELRPDLTIPEVRSQAELELFERLAYRGLPVGDRLSPWKPEIVREVDMTRDRRIFRRTAGTGGVPLLEGRMVHQFRSAAKSYVSGTGRRSIWDVNPLGVTSAVPQFYVRRDDLPGAARRRLDSRRVGFCDVTGQTNERTVLASVVDPGVACGNKVPTVLLPNAGTSDDALYAWAAIANSFVFDWLARRIVTTTLNYFLLESLPFPMIEPGSLAAKRLATLGRKAALAESNPTTDMWELGRTRAEIDVNVASAYGICFADLSLLLSDFPLLDRGQPALAGEKRSTVTTDVVLALAADLWQIVSDHSERAARAHAAGAVPYVPSSFADAMTPTAQCLPMDRHA